MTIFAQQIAEIQFFLNGSVIHHLMKKHLIRFPKLNWATKPSDQPIIFTQLIRLQCNEYKLEFSLKQQQQYRAPIQKQNPCFRHKKLKTRTACMYWAIHICIYRLERNPTFTIIDMNNSIMKRNI